MTYQALQVVTPGQTDLQSEDQPLVSMDDAAEAERYFEKYPALREVYGYGEEAVSDDTDALSDFGIR